MYFEYQGINAFLVGMSDVLLTHGVSRRTRGKICYELPQPVMIKIVDPTARIITLPERKWNYALPFVESLWLALGQNDTAMVTHYLKSLLDYSDDGVYMRGGYGPRFRYFNGLAEDYRVDGIRQYRDKNRAVEVDQFEYISKAFERDPYTRQAVITIGDPAKDCFGEAHILKNTMDFPCTKSLHFQRTGDRLDLIVHMRSNDFVWGACGVNIFNFTFIQEYFAQILGLKVGSYYHVADNFHYYDYHRELLSEIAAVKHVDDQGYTYQKTFQTLSEFDILLGKLKNFEQNLRNGKPFQYENLNDPFFDDWAQVLYVKTFGISSTVSFLHPALNKIRDRELLKDRSKRLKNSVSEDIKSNQKHTKRKSNE